MIDRELLELAAKAAGYKMADVLDGYPLWREGYGIWNPLTDDGDALRLAVELEMTIAFEPSRGGWSVGVIVGDEFAWLAWGQDCKRAIVLAAAEIGRAMFKKEFVVPPIDGDSTPWVREDEGW